MGEQAIYDWMRANVRRERPTILEIGAHHAEDSQRFLTMFDDPHVTAFEPDPRNIAAIKAKNEPRIKLVEKAVGAVDGTVTLHLSGGIPRGARGDDRGREWTYSSSVRAPKHHLRVSPDILFERTVEVPMCRLDTFYGQRADVIDFVWADVQGNEGDLIRGGLVALRRTRFFYTEYDDREMYAGQEDLAAITRLLGDGFERVGLFGNNVLFRNRELP